MRSRNDLPRAGPGPSLAWALAALTILLLWQFLTVHYNRGGNWTALFLTGTQYPVPQQLDAGTYRFPGAGYDGQMYRYVAHAPFSPKIYERYIDKAEDRYRRILIPALAYLLAGGQDAWIDGAYIALVALFVFLGAYWLSRWAVLEGAHPAWALAFLLAPATLISMDRMTVDVALAAFTAGFVLYSSSAEWTKFYFILMLACLARETGLLLVAGACAFELFRRRFPRALLWASAGVPALAWYAWLRHAYPARPRLGVPQWFANRIGPGLFYRMFDPQQYPLPPALSAVARISDSLALVGILLACVLTIVIFWRTNPKSPLVFAGLACTLLVILLTSRQYWTDVNGYARVMSPLLLLVSLPSVARQPGLGLAWWLGLVPTAVVDIRLALQFSSPVSGVLRGLLHL